MLGSQASYKRHIMIMLCQAANVTKILHIYVCVCGGDESESLAEGVVGRKRCKATHRRQLCQAYMHVLREVHTMIAH